MIQSLIHLKFFIIFSGTLFYFRNSLDKLKLIINFLFIATLVGLVINFALQINFNEFFDVDPEERGWLRLIGFQTKSNSLAATLALMYFYYLFKEKAKIEMGFFLKTSFVFLILLLLTGNRTSLLIMLLTFSLFFLDQIKKRPMIALYIVIVGMLSASVILLKTDFYERTLKNLEEATNPEGQYIRGLMLYYGLKISVNKFPIGTGAATYGSALSKGSHVYVDLGVAHRRFFINDIGIYDSNIATILGEFGWIGLSIFIFMGAYIYYLFKGRVQNKLRRRQFSLLLIFMYFYGFLNPVFMHSYTSLIFALTIAHFFLNCLKENESV